MNNLKKLRESKNLTQEELASKLGITKQQVYRIEADKAELSLSMALALFDILDIDLNEFFKEDKRYRENRLTLGSFKRVSYAPIFNWNEIKNYPKLDGENVRLFATLKVLSKEAFAVKLLHNFDRFLKGDTVVVDPGADISSGDFCLIVNEDEKPEICVCLGKNDNSQEYEFASKKQLKKSVCFQNILGKIVDLSVRL